MKIVVVDDSRMARASVVRVLHQIYEDLEVVEAGNGVEALKEIKTGSPDVVLCDWNMPRKTMTGLDVLKVLRSRGTTVPFGFITCEGSERTRATALRAGAQFLLQKPVNAAILREAIGEVLSQDEDDGAADLSAAQWADACRPAIDNLLPLVLGVEEYEVTDGTNNPVVQNDGGGYIALRTPSEVVQLGVSMDQGNRNNVVRQLLAQDPDDPDPPEHEMLDAVNELINILAGLVKTEILKQSGEREVELGIPYFMYGRMSPAANMTGRVLRVCGADMLWELHVLHRARHVSQVALAA